MKLFSKKYRSIVSILSKKPILRREFKVPEGFTRFFANTSGVTYTPSERTLIVSRSMHDAFVNNLYVIWEKSEQEGFYEFAVPAGKYFVVYGEFESFEKPETEELIKVIRALKPRVRSLYGPEFDFYKNGGVYKGQYRTLLGILRW